MRYTGLLVLLSLLLGSFLCLLPTRGPSTTEQVASGRDPVKPVPWGKPRVV
jgi:hypothetical protein